MQANPDLPSSLGRDASSDQYCCMTSAGWMCGHRGAGGFSVCDDPTLESCHGCTGGADKGDADEGGAGMGGGALGGEGGPGECCCCIEDVIVTSKQLPGGAVPEPDPGYGRSFGGSVGRTEVMGSYLGSMFTLTARLRRGSRKPNRNDQGDDKCSMDWYERVNHVKRDFVPKTSPPGESHWHNQSVRGDTTVQGKEWLGGGSADPCFSGEIPITDVPSLSAAASYGHGILGTSRIDPTLDIFVRFSSGGACACNNDHVTVSIRQILRSKGSGLSADGSSIVFRKERGFSMPSGDNTKPWAY